VSWQDKKEQREEEEKRKKTDTCSKAYQVRKKAKGAGEESLQKKIRFSFRVPPARRA